MEYMMIRSVKAGGNPADIPTPTLGLISDHHSNSPLRHHNSRQLNSQQPASSYAESFSTNNLNCIGSSPNLIHDPFTSLLAQNSGNSGDAFVTTASGNNRQAAKINVLYKNKEILDRIVMPSSLSSSSSLSSPFGITDSRPKNDLLGNLSRSRNHFSMTSSNVFVSTNNLGNKVIFLNSPPNSAANISPSQTILNRKKSKIKINESRRGSLWESSAKPNGLIVKRPGTETKKPVPVTTVPVPKPSGSAPSALALSVASLRKRKACNNNSNTSGTSKILFSPNNKKPKLSPATIEVKAELPTTKAITKSSLLSSMPNLLRSLDSDSINNSTTILSKFSKKLGKNKPEAKESRRFINSTEVRPSIRIENVFLRKYDPIRLLSRLRCTSSTSTATPLTSTNTGTSHTTTPARKIILAESYSSSFKVNNPQSNQLNSSFKANSIVNSAMVRKKENSVINCQRSFWSQTDNSAKQYPDVKVISKRRRSKRKKAVTTRKIKKYPKFQKRRRKYRVKYLQADTGISEKRLRIMAAVYLKRALEKLRTCKRKSKRRVKKLRVGSQLLSKTSKEVKKGQVVSATVNGEINPVLSARTLDLVPKPPTNVISKFQLHQCKLPGQLSVSHTKFPLIENPYLVHTVELLRHKRELQDRMEAMESEGVVYKLNPIPEKSNISKKYPFVTCNVSLNKRDVKRILSQQLLINLAHAGFTNTKLRPLEVLADATASFLTKMSVRLKEVAELETLGVNHEFPDPMERVLQEVGMGGVRGLEDFYRTKVTQYGQRMEEQCLQLRRQFAYKVRSKIGLGNSTSSSSPSSVGITASTTNCAFISSVSNMSGGSSSSAGNKPVVINPSKSACITTSITNTTSSSQPLSPGNSVLAEMLSSPDEIQVRTVQGSPMAATGVERQLEELMGAGAPPPPNVEIRPNSFHSRQQLPLHQLLTSLSQPAPQHLPTQGKPSPSSQQQSAQVVLHPAQTMQSHQAPLGTITVQQQKGFQQQQQIFQSQTSQHPHHQSLQPSLQGLHQQPQQQPTVASQQPHLTQLLQRPITNQGSPATTIITTPTSHPQQNQQHFILQHQAPTHYQGVVIQGNQQTSQQVATLQTQQLPQTVTAPISQRSVNINTTTNTVNASNCRQMLTIPIQMNLTKTPVQSQVVSSEQIISTTTTNNVPAGQSTLKNASTSKGKTVTIIRSASVSSPGIVVDKTRLVNSNQSTALNSPASLDVFSEYSPVNSSNPPTPTLHHHHQLQNNTTPNNIISINLGSNSIDLDPAVQPQTVTMHAVEASPLSQNPNPNSASKAKLKEAINQRNLLRLNFEQVPSAGDSTVLLSSSSTSSSSAGGGANAAVASAANVQFLGKVSSGQTLSWNSNYP